MMADFVRYTLLLVNAVSGFSSASGTQKYVCPGETVPAFQNIDFDRCNSLVSLNMIGGRNALIATWLFQNCTQNATLLKGYEVRVSLDRNGTITINNFKSFDQGTYVVYTKKDSLPSIQEVEIKTMVAPSKNCKPMIMRAGDKLFATLKPDDCGYPLATPYWLGDDGVADTYDTMLKITLGSETRTYSACIESPSLQCNKSLKHLDYCSSLVIEGIHHTSAAYIDGLWNFTATNLRTSTATPSTDVHLWSVIILPILLILTCAIVVFMIVKQIVKCRKRYKKNLNKETDVKLLGIPPPGEQTSGKDPEMNA